MASLLPLALPLSANDDADGYQLLKLDGYKVKWGEQQLGVGASVSYAFADETLQFDDARNCGELVPMEAIAGQDLPMETLARETAEAFEVWGRASGLSFHQVGDARDADIVLGAQGQPRGKAFANVAYAPEPQESVRTIDQALVCLNPDHQWKLGFDGNKDVYDIRYTLIHEIGHAIGLDHPGPSGQLMGFQYTEDFAELQAGDLDGVRRLYGHGGDDGGPANRVDTQLAEKSTGAHHANDVIGHSVMSVSEDEEIGSIRDLIIDQDGSILAVIVGVGSFLGIGDKDVALSWDSVELVQDGDGGKTVVRVKADANTLDGAPRYEHARKF